MYIKRFQENFNFSKIYKIEVFNPPNYQKAWICKIFHINYLSSRKLNKHS